jgi:hypothetical protein
MLPPQRGHRFNPDALLIYHLKGAANNPLKDKEYTILASNSRGFQKIFYGKYKGTSYPLSLFSKQENPLLTEPFSHIKMNR